MGVEEEKQKEVNQTLTAFNNVKIAIDQAMRGTFPMGMDAIEAHAQIRTSLQVLGNMLNKHFELAPKAE